MMIEIETETGEGEGETRIVIDFLFFGMNVLQWEVICCMHWFLVARCWIFVGYDFFSSLLGLL